MLRAAAPAGAELSLVDLVLLACDSSEDEGEVNDLVADWIGSGAARVVPERPAPPAVQRFGRLP